MAIKNKSEKGRFAVVGIANTVIDFGVLFLLSILGLPEIPANIASTSSALCFSFFANKKYTFKSSGTNVARELTLFIIVSLIGAWVIQSAILYITLPLLDNLHLSEYVSLFIAKVLAIAVGFVWNYFMYSKVVFKKQEEA